MNKYFLTGLLSFIMSILSFQSSAQKFNVTWGENAKMVKFDFDNAVMLSNGNYIILRTDNKGGRMNPKYVEVAVLADKNLVLISEERIEIEEKNYEVKGFNKYGDNVYFFYTAYDKKNKTTSLYAIKINDKTLASISKTNLGTFESDKENDQAAATYKISSDSSKVLLMVKGPRRKKENEKIFFAVFDTDLKKIWSKQVDLDIEQKYVQIHDVDVSNEGKIFLALKHYDNETQKETLKDEDGEKIPSYSYKMYVFENEAENAKIIKMDFQNLFIQGTKVINNKEGLITVSGLYRKTFKGRTSGVFYGILDSKTAEIKNPKIVEFPTSLLEKVDMDGFASVSEKDPGLSRNFVMRHILYRENGSVDLICEYYKLRVVHNTRTDSKGGMTTTTTYYYYYGDIVNTNINQQGDVVFTRVPKNQSFIDYSGYLGFAPIIYNNNLVLLYNDDVDNVEKELDKKPDAIKKFKKSAFVAATIDMKGNLSRQVIYNHKDESYITIPTETRRIENDKYLLIGNVMKAFRFRTRFGLLEMK